MQLVNYIKSVGTAMQTHALAAKCNSGKSYLAQFAEIIALGFGPGRLAPDEYYQYCLHDDRKYDWTAKQEFLGRRLENGLIPILKEEWWIGLAHDKLIAYSLLDHFGFPTPEIYAIYHRSNDYPLTPVVRDASTLASYIRTAPKRSFLIKPTRGMWGKSVWAVNAYDDETDSVVLKNQHQLSLDELMERLFNSGGNTPTAGALVQELLRPHPTIRSWCGDHICSVRVVTVADEDGPKIISTLWKIATGDSMADNYWEPGNMVVAVDVDTGEVDRPFSGLGLDLKYFDHHPDTGERLTGVVLPDWKEVIDLCLRATSVLSVIPMQAWDIALTDRGPVILEVNVNGGMRLPQLVKQRGLYRGELREFLIRHGFPGRRFRGWL